ncbi:MAG: VWA domain-containing protein, partial [Thermoanaerobaculia bacterium]
MSASAASSQLTDEHHGIFSETIDVTLVNLEIIATDGKGSVITDLTRDELRIFEDGEPVEIDYFTPPAVSLPAVTGGELELQSPAAVPQAMPPPERKHVIILVDNAHLSPANRNILLARMRREMGRLMDGDTWVMVVGKDRDIRIERRLTNDLSLVDAALAQIQESAQGGPLDIASGKLLQREMARARGPGAGVGGGALSEEEGLQDAREVLSSIQMHAQSLAQRVYHTCQVLNYFVDSLSGVPGRKALFYISDGLPISPGELLFRQWWQKYGLTYGDAFGVSSPQDSAQEYDTSEAILELISEAAANRVAFYPIDTSQEPGSRAVSAANTEVDLVEQTLLFGDADQVALGLLARSTGGVSTANSTGLKDLLDRVQEDFESYYSLGFVSRFQGDGKSHKVKVEVARKGVKLRYLDRYRSKNSDQLMADRTLAALYLDEATNPLNVRLELGEPTAAGADRGRRGRNLKKAADSFVVPVTVRLPLANLSLVPEDTAHTGNLSLFLVIQDEDGRTAPPIKIAVPVKIPHEKLLASMNQLVGYKTKVRMRGGEQKIAVGVRDDVSQVASTLNLSVNIG